MYAHVVAKRSSSIRPSTVCIGSTVFMTSDGGTQWKWDVRIHPHEHIQMQFQQLNSSLHPFYSVFVCSLKLFTTHASHWWYISLFTSALPLLSLSMKHIRIFNAT